MAAAEAERFDVAVIGGGYAGAQAALTLGRACRRVLVVDGGTPRNARAAHVHNFLGRHDPSPADLLADARAALHQHAVAWEQDSVVRAERIDADGDAAPHWRLGGARGGSWTARAVLLATGLRDELPDVPGVEQLWGRDVVACPHCHGWEVRGRPLAQLGLRGAPARGVERAVLLSRWSRDVVLFTDGDELTAPQRSRLAAAGVAAETGRVRQVVHRGGQLIGIELEDGALHARAAVFVVVKQSPQTDAAALFGCAPAADGVAVAVDGEGRTGVPGVWAAGTAAVPALLAVGAAGHAATVAVHLNNALIELDLAEGRPAVFPVAVEP
jgi:thioredoxin reductase (NADPH)